MTRVIRYVGTYINADGQRTLMTASQGIPMIDTETGEIDSLAIAEFAGLRACREWGGQDAPPAYHRNALQWTLDRAAAERLQWRQQRGLPDESPCTLVDTAGWTDSFRRIA
jgi:hypothetical protein